MKDDQNMPDLEAFEYGWPTVFSDRLDEPYLPDEKNETKRRLIALADQLMAWGNCHMQAKMPDNFEAVMVKLGKVSGATLPEDCSRLADKLIERLKIEENGE